MALKAFNQTRKKQVEELFKKLGPYANILLTALNSDDLPASKLTPIGFLDVVADEHDGWQYPTSVTIEGTTVVFRMDRHFFLGENLFTVGEAVVMDPVTSDLFEDDPLCGVYMLLWNRPANAYFLVHAYPGYRLSTMLRRDEID